LKNYSGGVGGPKIAKSHIWSRNNPITIEAGEERRRQPNRLARQAGNVPYNGHRDAFQAKTNPCRFARAGF
jgi:hypothetical protein